MILVDFGRRWLLKLDLIDHQVHESGLGIPVARKKSIDDLFSRFLGGLHQILDSLSILNLRVSSFLLFFLLCLLYLSFLFFAIHEILHELRILGHQRVGLKHAHQEFMSLPRYPNIQGNLWLLGGLVHVMRMKPTIKLLHPWWVHMWHTHVSWHRKLRWRLLIHRIHLMGHLQLGIAWERLVGWH